MQPYENTQSQSLKMPILHNFDESISLRMIENSRFNPQMTNDNYHFQSNLQHNSLSLHFLDQNAMRFQCQITSNKPKITGRKLMTGFSNLDLNYGSSVNQEANMMQKQQIQDNESKNSNIDEILMQQSNQTPQFHQTLIKQTQHNKQIHFLDTHANSSKVSSSLYSFNPQKEEKKLTLKPGLKSLSLQVKDILDKQKSASYKQITNIIIDNQMKNRSQCFEGEKKNPQKSSQNIKRRIYDSLNVLIAVGILKRSNNKLIMNNENKNSNQPNKSQLKKKSDVQQQIQKAKTKLQIKNNVLKVLNQKYQTLKKLRERNTDNPVQASQKLYAPIMFMITPESTNLQKVVQFDKNNLCLRVSEFQLVSELDLLTKYSETIFQ